VPRGADLITVVSDDLADHQAGRGISQTRVRVVPAGVNIEMFEHGDGARVRERHGLVGTPLVMYTGAYEQFQRIDHLLRAMQWVASNGPQAHLLLAGTVKNSANLKRYTDMARDLGIEKRVTFLDSVQLHELPDYLAAADVTVMPRTECPGHPVKLLNYMAAAKPIVSFRGAAKGLHHMHNGYLANDHDYVALGRGIQFLLEHPGLARSLGERACQTLHGVFDWDTLARGIEVLYWQLLDRGKSGAFGDANPYLKARYVLQYVERRTAGAAPAQLRRNGADRRKRDAAIHVLERRKLAFPAASHMPELPTGDAVAARARLSTPDEPAAVSRGIEPFQVPLPPGERQ